VRDLPMGRNRNLRHSSKNQMLVSLARRPRDEDARAVVTSEQVDETTNTVSRTNPNQ